MIREVWYSSSCSNMKYWHVQKTEYVVKYHDLFSSSEGGLELEIMWMQLSGYHPTKSI